MTKRFSIHPKRQEDPAHLNRIRALPCIACEHLGVEQDSPTESHHIRRRADGQLYGASQKAHDREAIPLCQKRHHWNGVHCASKLSHREFEATFGNERDLLTKTMERLGEEALG